eukprot:4314569-Prymnesium_polylepis.1
MLCRDHTSRPRARECADRSPGLGPKRQTTHPFIHSDHKRAVNRLPEHVAVRPDMVHCGRTSRLSI